MKQMGNRFNFFFCTVIGKFLVVKFPLAVRPLLKFLYPPPPENTLSLVFSGDSLGEESGRPLMRMERVYGEGGL
jgi:hypothetical protein